MEAALDYYRSLPAQRVESADADPLEEFYERRATELEADIERWRYLDQRWNLGPDDELPR